MKRFEDPETAARSLARLEAANGLPLGDLLGAFDENANPDLALVNLERWLQSNTQPYMHLQQMLAYPELAKLLVTLLGASQPIADSIIQNPELASLVLEPGAAHIPPTVAGMLAEGRRLLVHCSSHTHELDRLRFLKQHHLVPIVVADLQGFWPQEVVWRALSDLAEAIVLLTVEVSWRAYAASKSLPSECPISVVAFGKLGGRELNYSSDIDLAYVTLHALDDTMAKHATRFCEVLSRAFSDRMGRGSLFRVDLRLRPYGAAGPILQSMKAVSAYYRLYAEPWETQALLKSRPIAGLSLEGKWAELVAKRSYPPRLDDVSLAEMLRMRRRIETECEPDDLKRGSGGIRDVEFLVQILQMAHGHDHPNLQLAATCDALRALVSEGWLESSVAATLLEGYTFLRKLEHRLQLVGDRQTHAIPASPPARKVLARLMGFPTWAVAERELNAHRMNILSLYRVTFGLNSDSAESRDLVLTQVGNLAAALAQWFDSLPESAAYYESLLENRDSLNRVKQILDSAPALVSEFRKSLPLTELLLSGEIEEPSVASRLMSLPSGASVTEAAHAYQSAIVNVCARWILQRDFSLEHEISGLATTLLRFFVARVGGELDVMALGSFGSEEMSLGSDLDLLILTDGSQADAEHRAEALLMQLRELRQHGVSLEVDLRLRPDGGKGLLVRSYDGLRNYQHGDMELWERFALGQARLIAGRDQALAVVNEAAYALPITPERLDELLAMKTRIETERVKSQHSTRDVKLGVGGLNDIEWLVRLHEMRFPTATHVGSSTRLPERIRNLGRAELLNALEVTQLLEAHEHLTHVRHHLNLLEIPDGIVPENPDRLDRLARAMALNDGNAFLRQHHAIIEFTRSLYSDCIARLKQ